MKITKFPQSCLMLEEAGKRIVIDPGSFVARHYKAADLFPIDGVLLTHEHPDHADPELLKSIIAGGAMPVIGNQSTASLLGDIITQVVTDGEAFEVAGFKVVAKELPHMALVDGRPGPQNTGYVVNGIFFDAGDGTAIKNLTIKSAAIPIAGPDVSPRDVYSFIKMLGCETVIPIHYDLFPADPEFYKTMFSSWFKLPVNFIALANGESTEI